MYLLEFVKGIKKLYKSNIFQNDVFNQTIFEKRNF